MNNYLHIIRENANYEKGWKMMGFSIILTLVIPKISKDRYEFECFYRFYLNICSNFILRLKTIKFPICWTMLVFKLFYWRYVQLLLNIFLMFKPFANILKIYSKLSPCQRNCEQQLCRVDAAFIPSAHGFYRYKQKYA